jgi:PAS domain S-box-containing protein
MEICVKKLKILCICGENTLRSVMAEGFLRKLGGDRLEVQSAGVKQGEYRPEVAEVLSEVGIDAKNHSPRSVAELRDATFDVVITLCDQAKEYCTEPRDQGTFVQGPIFVGDPVHIHWSIQQPDLTGEREKVLERLRGTREQVHERVKAFLEHGYFAALRRERWHLDQVLDSMEDGVILHDKDRNIYLFNRAAESITGYRREEVLGRNCHRVFPPDGLCGSQCPMDNWSESFQGKQYEVAFTTKQGEDKRLRMTSGPIEIEEGGKKGVIATFRDITEYSELRFKMKEKYSFHGMVGMSAAMQDVFLTIRQVTTADYPVLISGESGTGKELVARAIHNESRRKARAFVPINCGALPETILESELFGHVRGAFTGAIRDKKGRFELADRGTLFLDEVGELSPAFQVKLLRVLEEKTFEPVGGEKTVSVDVRVISATNRDLRQMVREDRFREDLFYRLSVVPIHLPPLRQRREDIPLLVEQLLKTIRQDTKKPIRSLSDGAMDLLMDHQWPGNIRELINALQFASVRCDKEKIQRHHLPPEIRNVAAPLRSPKAAAALGAEPRRRKLDRDSVEQALKETGGNKVKAAKLLGIGRATLYRFLRKHPPVS